MRIALLSDTHIPQRLAQLPRKLLNELQTVDAIIHCGDFTTLATLRALRRIATTYAVHGNVDAEELQAQLPLDLDLTLEGHRLGVTHGHDKGQRVDPRDLFCTEQGRRSAQVQQYLDHLAEVFPNAGVIVFGHYHAAFVKRRNGRLFVNPGAVAPYPERATFAILELGPPPEEPSAHIVALD